MADAYDEHPYTAHAYAETHPCRVAAVAGLSAWQAPGVDGARVLELGCGRGGNLLPMAAGLPTTSFLGIDLSARQIADAERAARGASLDNVTFLRASFDEIDLAPGSFDYIICHGVLSWIAPHERSPLLATMARCLSPGGVAHVSYNVLPGWYDRLAARDWLRFATASLDAAPETSAQSLQWLSNQLSPELADYRRRLDEVARRLVETDAAYARHEYLAGHHHPLLVRAFLAQASATGLAYLGDAIPATTALEMLPEPARQRAAQLGEAEAQQLVDFVRCTAFRRTILVRADEAHRRSWSRPAHLDASAIEQCWIASRLRPHEGFDLTRTLEAFGDGTQTVQVSNLALRRALHDLARAAPLPRFFGELVRESMRDAALSQAAIDALAAELCDLGLATSAIDFLSAPPAFSGVAGERPVACPFARWQAAHGGVVTNRLHQEVEIPDAVVRWVLLRLDGTRTRGSLAEEARGLADEARAVSQVAIAADADLQELVAASVDRLVACALIVPPGRPARAP